MIKLTAKQIDKVTRQWIRNPGDEDAARTGARFDAERGQFVVDWIEHYLRLYEGEYAGQPFKCIDWQRDALMRMFSWIRLDEERSRQRDKDVWGRRFTHSVIFVPKKNGKSPLLAALGLYLTCGDGEPGSKSFFFAKDGNQAREIAGKHAVEMLWKSPELMSECTVNKNLMQITHEPTRSILLPASSGDDRHQKSKEGINGNILVDEVHVVDRALMDRISRAGISRSEPFQIEVSTAGNDPGSYGKTRYEYAKDVLAGTIKDDRLFVMLCEAPQELTDKQIDADPIKYGKMANPSWGYTIREREYLSDYEQSKRGGATELASFKMYRLNIWQKTANPLIDQDSWRENERRYTLDELAGRGGGVGIDLSKSEDMSAIVFCVPDDEDADIMRIYPKFWMTRDYAQKNNHLASFLDWAAEGDLELVDAAAIMDLDLLPWILLTMETIKPTLICYDPTYAEALTQKIATETEIDVAKFGQTFPVYSNPTIEFRNAIKDGRLLHNGNQVMSWQAGHVMAKEYNGLIKPVKDDKQRHRKIDGIQAAIMAWHACKERPQEERSVYEDRGALFL